MFPILGRQGADLDTHFLKSFCVAKSAQKVCFNFQNVDKALKIGFVGGNCKVANVLGVCGIMFWPRLSEFTQ